MEWGRCIIWVDATFSAVWGRRKNSTAFASAKKPALSSGRNSCQHIPISYWEKSYDHCLATRLDMG